MRKRFVTPSPATVQARGEGWLDLEHAAAVEVTSEDKDFPIESALSIERGQGWRAAEPGVQTIRLVFDEPQELKRISLVFEEDEITRTQEFVLRASSNSGGPFRDFGSGVILLQRYSTVTLVPRWPALAMCSMRSSITVRIALRNSRREFVRCCRTVGDTPKKSLS